MESTEAGIDGLRAYPAMSNMIERTARLAELAQSRLGGIDEKGSASVGLDEGNLMELKQATSQLLGPALSMIESDSDADRGLMDTGNTESNFESVEGLEDRLKRAVNKMESRFDALRVMEERRRQLHPVEDDGALSNDGAPSSCEEILDRMHGILEDDSVPQVLSTPKKEILVRNSEPAQLPNDMRKPAIIRGVSCLTDLEKAAMYREARRNYPLRNPGFKPLNRAHHKACELKEIFPSFPAKFLARLSRMDEMLSLCEQDTDSGLVDQSDLDSWVRRVVAVMPHVPTKSCPCEAHSRKKTVSDLPSYFGQEARIMELLSATLDEVIEVRRKSPRRRRSPSPDQIPPSRKSPSPETVVDDGGEQSTGDNLRQASVVDARIVKPFDVPLFDYDERSQAISPVTISKSGVPIVHEDQATDILEPDLKSLDDIAYATGVVQAITRRNQELANTPAGIRQSPLFLKPVMNKNQHGEESSKANESTKEDPAAAEPNEQPDQDDSEGHEGDSEGGNEGGGIKESNGEDEGEPEVDEFGHVVQVGIDGDASGEIYTKLKALIQNDTADWKEYARARKEISPTRAMPNPSQFLNELIPEYDGPVAKGHLLPENVQSKKTLRRVSVGVNGQVAPVKRGSIGIVHVRDKSYVSDAQSSFEDIMAEMHISASDEERTQDTRVSDGEVQELPQRTELTKSLPINSTSMHRQLQSISPASKPARKPVVSEYSPMRMGRGAPIRDKEIKLAKKKQPKPEVLTPWDNDPSISQGELVV